MSILPPIKHKRNAWEYSEIAFMASEAAVDLDTALTGQDPDVKAVQELYLWLQTWISDNRANLFEIKTQILLDVWGDSLKNRNITVDEAVVELKEKVKTILPILTRFSEDRPFQSPLTREEIETARDFCLALSRSAIAESQEDYC
jgi:hypothetical protein